MISGAKNQSEILVYNRKSAPFFGGRFYHFNASLVSYDPSRKSFLGKLIGLAAVAGLAPRLLAKSPAAAPAPVAPALAVRPEPRAVARRTGAA
jgi:hypothetical protein